MDRPTVPEVAPLVRAFYAKPGNSAGGVLHVVLDDGNLDNGSVRYVLDEAVARGDSEAEAIARALLAMTKTQRRKVRDQIRRGA